MRWLFPWWRHRHQARDRDREATAELATSRELLQRDQEKAERLIRANQRNMFSDMIRDALVDGYHHRPPHATHGGRGKA